MKNKKTIILIPGMMSDHRLWEPQIKELKKDFELYVFFSTQHASITEMTAAFLESAPKKFALFGTSMGGYLAIDIALQAKNRITHLGLFNTNAHEDFLEKSEARIKEINEGESQFIEQKKNIHNFEKFISPDCLNKSDICKTLSQMNIDLGYNTFKNHQQACISRKNSSEKIKKITIPTAIVGGKDDIITPPQEQTYLASKIKKSTLLLLENCGHIATLEKPDLVTNEIIKLLER
jgi:pimeloyl-ACP methyl ester carboxylesterase